MVTVTNYNFNGLGIFDLNWYTGPGFYIQLDNSPPSLGPYSDEFEAELAKQLLSYDAAKRGKKCLIP